MRNTLVLLILACILLTGCVSKLSTPIQKENILLNKAQRDEYLQQVHHWTIDGKIGFITPNERQSASLFWQFNELEQNQQLNITTYLGINVLSLKSKSGSHQVSFDGNEYQSNNLDHLITSLTGWTIPTKAMNHWLKGLAYSNSDSITYNAETALPQTLTSLYDNKHWQINYDDYQQFGPVMLAKKFTIKQNNLTIKIAIKRWKI